MNGALVLPSLSLGQEWNCKNVLANAKQGDVYLRACNPLVSIVKCFLLYEDSPSRISTIFLHIYNLLFIS